MMTHSIKAVRNLILTAFVFFGMAVTDSFGVPSAQDEIAKLEKMEKTSPPERIERRQVQYDLQNSRDPFQGPTARLPDTKEAGSAQENEGASLDSWSVLPPLTVQGIIWGGVFPQAIINNKVLKAGDTLRVSSEGREITIISIDKEGVLVTFADRQYNLRTSAAGAGFPKRP